MPTSSRNFPNAGHQGAWRDFELPETKLSLAWPQRLSCVLDQGQTYTLAMSFIPFVGRVVILNHFTNHTAYTISFRN